MRHDYVACTQRKRLYLAGDWRWFDLDSAAAVGATRVAERRLGALIERYSPETVEQFVDEWIDYGSRRMVEEIKSLPQGTWENEATLDPLSFAPEGVTVKSSSPLTTPRKQ